MTKPEKLRAIADWFDNRDRESGSNTNEVQKDLRGIADELEQLGREKYVHFIERRYPTPNFPKGGIEAMSDELAEAFWPSKPK